MWWAIWLASVALLGLVMAKHPSAEVRELAESFRHPDFVLPAPIILHRGMAKTAGYTLVISIVLAAAAFCRPHEANVLIPLAVGLALLFFAFHTLFYSQTTTEWMRGVVRKHAATP